MQAFLPAERTFPARSAVARVVVAAVCALGSSTLGWAGGDEVAPRPQRGGGQFAPTAASEEPRDQEAHRIASAEELQRVAQAWADDPEDWDRGLVIVDSFQVHDPGGKRLRQIAARAAVNHRGAAAAQFIFGLAQRSDRGRRRARETLRGLSRDALPARTLYDLWRRLAAQDQAHGDLAAAAKSMQEATLAFPQAAAFAHLGLLLRATGRMGDARDAYAEAVRRNPSELAPRYALTSLCAQHGDHETALRLARGTLELAPRSATAHAQWGLALARAGLQARGRRACELALRLAEDDVAVLTALAGIFAQVGASHVGRRAVERALESDAAYVPAHLHLVTLALRSRDLKAAKASLATLNKLAPADARVAYLEAVIARAEGRKGVAMRAVRRARKSRPHAWNYVLLESRLALERSGDRLAARVLEQSMESGVRHPQILRELSRLYISSKRYREAERVLEGALVERPEDPEPLFHLALLYRDHLTKKSRRIPTLLEAYEARGGRDPVAHNWLAQMRAAGK